MTGSTLVDAYKEIEERQAYIPNAYRSFGPVVGTAAQSIQPETYFDSSRFNTAPLMEFRAEQRAYILSKPLLVKIHREDDVFLAENDTLSLHGIGTSKEEALADLIKHLEYFHNFYRQQSESNLIGNGLRLKKIYADLFVEA